MADKYIENFFEAMGIITKNAIDKAGYDRTVKGIIESAYDNNKKSHNVNISGAIRTAYSEKEYKIGDVVYVLEPGGNTSAQLQIIGKEQNAITEKIDEENTILNYTYNGGNMIQNYGSQTLSGPQTTLILYNSEDENTWKNFNINHFNAYIKNSLGFQLDSYSNINGLMNQLHLQKILWMLFIGSQKALQTS